MHFAVHFSNQLRAHLKALRKDRGLTQAALGQLLGVGQARIAEIENNPGVVSVEQLMKVLGALRVSMVLHDDRRDGPESQISGVAKSPAAQEPKVMARPLPRAAATAAAGVPVKKDALPVARRNLVIHAKKGSW